MADLNVTFGAEEEPGASQRLGRNMGNKVRAGMKSSKLGDIGKDINAALKSVRGVGKLGDDFDGLNAKIKDVQGTTRRLRDEMGDMAGAATKMGSAFRRVEGDADELKDDLAALKVRSESFKKSMSAAGVDTGAFAVYDREFRKLIKLQDRVERNFDEIAESPELQADLRRRERLIETGLSRETASIKTAQKTQRDARHDAEVKIRQNKQIAANKNLQVSRAEHGKEVSLTQTAGAREVAIIKANAAKKLQSSRKSARFRLEIARQLFRQLRTIERSIGAVFKGTAAIVQGAFARVERTVFRIGGVFRRGNKGLTKGLQPALNRREGIIRRSFGRQEANVRGSVARQSVTLRRFETQASTGIAGALSGRSSLGALFGGGLAIGGGFSLFRKLSQSIEVGGDFIQGLAVLQAQLQLTGEQMVGVRQLSIDLGNDITLPGVSALDAAQAIAALTKQFGSLGDAALPAAEAAAKGVLSLSRATGSSAEDAAAIVGAATNVFGISADDAVATADKITAALTRAAGVGVTEFKDSFTQAANVFALFQKPALGAEGALVELNTAIAVLAKGGLTGSQAGTGLKQFFIQSVKTGDSFVALRKQIADTAGVTGSVFFKADGSARAFTDSIDILREGLKGMSDQQKTSTLTTLFGARASTVANILITESAESFALLREAQTRQGAAADVATAQNVGLRGALDALGSVIETQQIKTYEKWQGVVAKVVLRMADLFQVFFDGTGKIATLRTAIQGLVIALGGLLALKGAFELTKFLGIGLTGLISPIGILVVGVGALGAAFAVLLKSSTDFRTAFSNIGSSLGKTVVPVLKLVGDLFARFVNLLNDEVVPAVVKFSIALAEKLETQIGRFIRFLKDGAVPALVKFKDAFVEVAGPILRDVINFIGDVANPIIKRLGQLIDITVVPAFNKLAEVLSDKVDPAIQKVRDVAGAVRDEIGPLVQPATDAFKALGEAIGAIAGKRAGSGFADTDFSDLSALIPAFQDVVSGIAQSFVNLAERIIEVVGPQIPRVLGFIESQFSEEKLLGILQGLGRIAVAIGTAIGAVASSPEFLGALAALAGTAAFVAVKFLEGLARGLAIGLPRTFAVLKNELGPSFNKLLKQVFNPAVIAKAVLAGFLAVGLASSIVATMRRPVNQAGQKVGDGFVKSFSKRVRFGVGAATSRNPLLSGFRAGDLAGLERQAAQAAEAQASVLDKAQRRAAVRLKNLGIQPRIGQPGAFGTLPPGTFKTSTDQLDSYAAHLGGTAKLLGTELRVAGRNIAGGFKDVIKGVFDTKGSQTIQRGFDRVQTGFRAGFAGIRDNLKATGRGVGQAAGTALLGGIISAISGQAAGSALASGNTAGALGGIAGVLSGALIATSVSPILGAAVLAVGGLTTALSFNSEKAKKAKNEIKEYADALAGATTNAELLTAATGGLGTNLAEENVGTISFLNSLKFSTEELANRVLNSDLGLSQLDVQNAFLLADGFGSARDEYIRFVDQVRRRGGDPALALEALRSGADKFGPKLANALGGSIQAYDDLIPLVQAITADLDSQGRSTVDLAEAYDFLSDETKELLQGRDIGADLSDISQRTLEGIEAAKKLAAGFSPIEEIRFDNIKDGLKDLDEVAKKPVASVGQIQQAIAELNRLRTEPLQAELADVTAELDVLKSTVSEAREELLDLIDGDYKGTLQQVTESALLAIPQIASGLREALNDTRFDGLLSGPAVNQQLEVFGALVTGVVQKGLAEAEVAGITLSPEAVTDLVQPILDLIPSLTIEVDGVQVPLTDAEVKLFHDEVIERVGNPEIEGHLSFIIEGAAEIKDLQDRIDKLSVDIKAHFVFDVDQINAALLKLFPDGNFQLVGGAAAKGIQADPSTFNEGTPLSDAELASMVTAAAAAVVDAQGSSFASDPDFIALLKSREAPTTTTTFNVEQYISGVGPPLLVASESIRALVSASNGGQFSRITTKGRLGP